MLRGGAEYLGHYLAARTVAAAPNTKAYMIGRFGKTLSETFFRSYVEKLYGRPWNEIDPDFARRSPLPARARRRAATFPYPSQGTGAICDGLAREIVAAGGQIRTNSPAERIDLEPAATIASNGSVDAYDHIVSTLPLGVLARCVAGAPASVGQAAAHLTARSTVLVYLDIHGSQCFPELWRFVYDAGYRMGRVANIARWWPPGSARPAPPNRTVLCTEYWCTRDDATWRESDADLALVCERELRACDILPETAPASAPRTYGASRARIRYRASTRLRTSGTWATTSRPSTISMSSAAMPSTVRATSPTTCRPVPRSARGSPRCVDA